MKILALEFSTERRSVAVVDAEAGEKPRVLGTAEESAGRSTQAFRLIAEVLRSAGVEREEVGVLAVGLGPGSYAGIRVALALAQGWQVAYGVRVVGISSLGCMATGLQAAGEWGRWLVAVDAQRGEYYTQEWAIEREAVVELRAMGLAGAAEIAERMAAGETVAGPEVVERFGVRGRRCFPEAAVLGRMAAGLGEFVRAETLEPICLRAVEYVRTAPPRKVEV